MRRIVSLLIAVLPALSFGQPDLSSKIVHLSLNQNEPAVIEVGIQGITTVEFPTKIEALDGYGFSLNPAPDGLDLFQISFNKGTNFLSLKAMHPRVEGNLTVVLEGKVYSLFCKETPDPSFVVIFDGGTGHSTKPIDVLAKTKAASPARVMGFLDKVKGFPALKNSAPEMFATLEIAEPGTRTEANGISVVLKRVIRDDAIDSVGFEVELINRTDHDFLYDPESFGARVGDEVYAQTVSDAGGLVPAGKSQTAYFVVTGSANGNRNDLAVTNKFDVIFRQVTGEMDPQRKISAEWQEPPDSMPEGSVTPEQTRQSDPTAKATPTATPTRRKGAHRVTGKGQTVAQHD